MRRSLRRSTDRWQDTPMKSTHFCNTWLLRPWCGRSGRN